MKKPNLLITSLLMAAAVITGCTKTEDPVDESLKQGEATLARIMDFKSQMEEAKANPNAKSSTYMSVADAVWNVEALFNLTYAYPEYNYGRTVACDTTLHLPVSSNDSVLVNDLSAFYGQMFDAVQAIYQSVDLDNKQFLILDVEAGERNGALLAMELHTVQGSVKGGSPNPDIPGIEYGPFEECCDWYYGKNGGMRDFTLEGIMDAADTITNMLNARLIPVAQNGYEYFYTQVKTKTSIGHFYPFHHGTYNNCGQFCEFFKEYPTDDDKWMNTDMLNFHYLGERHLVTNLLPNQDTPVPSTHSLFQVIVWDYELKRADSLIVIGHHTEACYGLRDVVGQGAVNRDNL